MKTKLIFVILTAGLTALSAQSEDRERGPRPDMDTIFANADANQDTVLDLKEFEAFRATMQHGPRGNRRGPNAENDSPSPRQEGQRGRGGRGGRPMPTAEEMFASLDKNEDGKIARDEFTLGNRRGRGPGGGQGERARGPE